MTSAALNRVFFGALTAGLGLTIYTVIRPQSKLEWIAVVVAWLVASAMTGIAILAPGEGKVLRAGAMVVAASVVGGAFLAFPPPQKSPEPQLSIINVDPAQLTPVVSTAYNWLVYKK
jgi:hypothetical protein